MRGERICATSGCQNAAAQHRTICNTCHSRINAERNPLQHCYKNLRNNARRRGKSFSLTFEEFEKFCQETEYLNKRGRNKKGYTIDRIDPTRGYHADNIQVLTNTQNVRKKALVDAHWDPQQRRMQFYTRSLVDSQPMQQPDCPF